MSRPKQGAAPVRSIGRRAPMLPPTQEIYPLVEDVQIANDTTPDGEAIRVTTFILPGIPQRALSFVLPAEAAQEVGKALTAPSVVVPKPGEAA